MIKFIRNQSLKVSAIVTLSMLGGAENSFAAATNFSTISTNVSTSIASLPGLLAGVSYMIGILLGVLGILKIKDHVENPTQTPLQHGAIRLVAGGGLFALPIVFEAMQGTIDNGAGTGVTGPTLTGIGTGIRTP
jgi:hypothetical protein